VILIIKSPFQKNREEFKKKFGRRTLIINVQTLLEKNSFFKIKGNEGQHFVANISS